MCYIHLYEAVCVCVYLCVCTSIPTYIYFLPLFVEKNKKQNHPSNYECI